MEDERDGSKIPSCFFGSPGPVYKLPTLVGFEGHDPSRRRNPAYSLYKRTGAHLTSSGPGPCYNVKKLTHHGLDNPPAYSIAGRRDFKILDSGPGPGAYRPEKCPPMNHSKRPPAYSLNSRGKSLIPDTGPGPNAYSVASCIGPKVPDKKASAAYSIAGYHRTIGPDVLGPGPGAYKRIDYNLIKRSPPAYSLKSRHLLKSTDSGPGPRYYPLYNTRKNPPIYSFGVKHHICAATPITEQDEAEE